MIEEPDKMGRHGFWLSLMLFGLFSGNGFPVSAQPNTGIWDGRWTDAKSGIEGNLMEEKNSEGKSGIKDADKAQKFYIQPENRKYHEVDRDELADYAKGDYTHYALVLVQRDIAYRGKTISKGYYHVKIGAADAGSPATQIHPGDVGRMQPLTAEQLQQPKTVGKLRKHPNPTFYQTLVLKRNGKVVAVLPITEKVPYERQKGEKKIKQPIATLKFDDFGVPTLVYNDGETLYLSNLMAQGNLQFPLRGQGISPLQQQGSSGENSPPQQISLPPARMTLSPAPQSTEF